MTVSSGFALEIHYCMGKRAGIDLYSSPDGKCGRCGMKEKKAGCCSDEHQFYKLADAHKNVSANDHVFVAAAAVFVDQPSFLAPVFTVDAVGLFNCIPLPADSGPPIFLRNCSFRI